MIFLCVWESDVCLSIGFALLTVLLLLCCCLCRCRYCCCWLQYYPWLCVYVCVYCMCCLHGYPFDAEHHWQFLHFALLFITFNFYHLLLFVVIFAVFVYCTLMINFLTETLSTHNLVPNFNAPCPYTKKWAAALKWTQTFLESYRLGDERRGRTKQKDSTFSKYTLSHTPYPFMHTWHL